MNKLSLCDPSVGNVMNPARSVDCARSSPRQWIANVCQIARIMPLQTRTAVFMLLAVISLLTPRLALAQHPIIEHLQQEQKADVPLNPREAIAAMNRQLGIANGLIDSKVLFADAVKPADFIVTYAPRQGADPAKALVFVSEMTNVPAALAELQTELVKAQLDNVVQATDYSVISFVPVDAPQLMFTAASMSFTITCASGNQMPMALILMMGVADAASGMGERQHLAAANFASEETEAPFPPGTILPFGTPLPAAPASQYANCVAKLGPKPSSIGVTNPCDKAIAEALVCYWEADCEVIRSMQVVTRKYISGSAGVLVGASGALGIGLMAAGVVACPPAGIVIAVVAVVGGVASSYDSLEDGHSAMLDAAAARQRRAACRKILELAILQDGVCF